MSPPRVLLDVDGVLCDFIGGVLALVAEFTGESHTHDDVDRYDFFASLGVSPDVKYQVARAISVRPRWWTELPVLPGAQVGVAELLAIADVWIVTSPWDSCPTWLWERQAWIDRHFGIPASRVISTHAKHLVNGDWIVDDRTETLRACKRAGLCGSAATPIQWATPHNRQDGWTGRTAHDWDAVMFWVRQHEREVLR